MEKVDKIIAKVGQDRPMNSHDMVKKTLNLPIFASFGENWL